MSTRIWPWSAGVYQIIRSLSVSTSSTLRILCKSFKFLWTLSEQIAPVGLRILAKASSECKHGLFSVQYCQPWHCWYKEWAAPYCFRFDAHEQHLQYSVCNPLLRSCRQLQIYPLKVIPHRSQTWWSTSLHARIVFYATHIVAFDSRSGNWTKVANMPKSSLWFK